MTNSGFANANAFGNVKQKVKNQEPLRPMFRATSVDGTPITSGRTQND